MSKTITDAELIGRLTAGTIDWDNSELPDEAEVMPHVRVRDLRLAIARIETLSRPAPEKGERERIANVVGKAVRESGYITNPDMNYHVADAVLRALDTSPAPEKGETLDETTLDEIWKLLRVAQHAASKLNTMYIRRETERRHEIDTLIEYKDAFFPAMNKIKAALNKPATKE